MYDEVDLDELGVAPEFKQAVYSLCSMQHDPELLTTTDKFRVSCVEALRLGYLLSKYLGVERREFMEGLNAVMELEDNTEENLH